MRARLPDEPIDLLNVAFGKAVDPGDGEERFTDRWETRVSMLCSQLTGCPDSHCLDRPIVRHIHT
jgi:hypothetical protein